MFNSSNERMHSDCTLNALLPLKMAGLKESVRIVWTHRSEPLMSAR